MIKLNEISVRTRQNIHKRIKLCLIAIPVLLCLNLSYLVHFTSFSDAPKVLNSSGIVTNKIVRDGRYYVFLNDTLNTERVVKETYDNLNIGDKTELYVEGHYNIKQVLSFIVLGFFYIAVIIGFIVWCCVIIEKYNDWVDGY